jgi:hypothetical protein
MKTQTAENSRQERPHVRANGHANGHADGNTLEPGSSRAPQTAAAVEAPRNVATRGSAPQSRGGLSTERPAVSDDEGRKSVAGAATNGAACADSESYADLAGSRDPGNPSPLPGKRKRAKSGSRYVSDPQLLLAGAELPEEAAGFVDEMSQRVNLYEVCKELLLSDDEKVKQRGLERLLEMKYGKVGPANPSDSSEDPPRLSFEGVMGPSEDES